MMVSRPLGRYPWELTSVLKLLALLAPPGGKYKLWTRNWGNYLEDVAEFSAKLPRPVDFQSLWEHVLFLAGPELWFFAFGDADFSFSLCLSQLGVYGAS